MTGETIKRFGWLLTAAPNSSNLKMVKIVERNQVKQENILMSVSEHTTE